MTSSLQVGLVGDPTAGSFEKIYGEWYRRVVRWVRALGAAEADREDVAQEVFVIAHRQLSGFDGRNVGAWLYQITRWKVRDHRCLSYVKFLRSDRCVSLSDVAVQNLSAPVDQAAELSELLARILSCLAEQKRRTLLLFELDGLTGEEIAELLGVPLNTVWSRIYAARKQLRSSAFRLKLGPASQRLAP